MKSAAGTLCCSGLDTCNCLHCCAETLGLPYHNDDDDDIKGSKNDIVTTTSKEVTDHDEIRDTVVSSSSSSCSSNPRTKSSPFALQQLARQSSTVSTTATSTEESSSSHSLPSPCCKKSDNGTKSNRWNVLFSRKNHNKAKQKQNQQLLHRQQSAVESVAAAAAKGQQVLRRSQSLGTGSLCEERQTVVEWTPNKATTTTTTTQPQLTKKMKDNKLFPLLMNGEEPMAGFTMETEFEAAQSMVDALSDTDRHYLFDILKDPTMPLRHFRAEKGHLETSHLKFQAALTWRREFGVHDIRQCVTSVVEQTERNETFTELHAMLCTETASGKIYSRGYDRDGRALMYMRPARENTHNALHNMKHLVFQIEKAMACTRHKSVQLRKLQSNNNNKEEQSHQFLPLDRINLVIDYQGFRLQDSPPLSTTKWTLDILQKHYPECMFRAFVINAPFVFTTFWALIKSFIDPVTKQKIVFCSGGPHPLLKFTTYVTDTNKVEVVVGGTNPTIAEFDSQIYMHLPFHISFDE